MDIDLVEIAKGDHSVETGAVLIEGQDSTMALEKCTKLSALNAARNVKFLSSQLKEDQYIVKSAI
jgi:hypothetical protein